MRTLKSGFPWFISVLTGTFIIWDFIAGIEAINIYNKSKPWVEARSSTQDYIIAYSLILSVGLPLIWWTWCAFHRKWVFIIVSMSASVFSVFMAFLIATYVFAMMALH